MGLHASTKVAAKLGPAFTNELESFGDRSAVVTENGAKLSYIELAHAADAFAARLGDTRKLLLIEATNSVAALVGYLGALRGGHVVILASEGASERDARLCATYAPSIYARREGVWTLGLADTTPPLHPDLAVLLSTSGSTGTTKLVRLSTAAINANAQSIVDYLGIGADDRALTTLPLHYSYGLSVVNSHLAAGATVLLTGRSVIEPEMWDFAAAQAPTSLAGVPYTYELLDRVGFADCAPPSLRTLTQAGGRLPADAVARWAAWAAARDARMFVMYGQTEATARMAYLPSAELASHPDCIGVAIPGGAFTLRADDATTVTTDDTPGELIYRGPNIMMGYAETAADLARPADLDELATGDIAVRNAAGLYRIVGRKSRFIKPFGLRIELDEVEATMRRHGWRGVAAGDNTVIAVEVLGDADPTKVAAALAADFKLSTALFSVHGVADHTLLPSGKIDYKTILANAHADRAEATADDPVDAAFALAFGDRIFGVSDSFARLGGDSLSYVTVSLALEDALGDLPRGWESMPIAALRARRRQHQRRGWLRLIDSDIVLRALAIIAVVVSHASDFVLGGGAYVLLILAGYNLARFQRIRLMHGKAASMIKDFVSRIILPYYAILVVYLAWKHEFNLPALLLIGNFVGEFRSFIEPYWFLEVLLQIYLIIALLFLIPVIRRVARRSPWSIGLWLFGGAALMRTTMPHLFDHAPLAGRTPDTLFVFVALGWCVAFADTSARRLTVLGLTLALGWPGLIGNEALQWSTAPLPAKLSHSLWQVVAIVLLLWVPRVPVPSMLHGVVTTVAAASFYIYLTQGLPVHVLRTRDDIALLAVAVLASIVLGIAAWWTAERLGRIRQRPTATPTSAPQGLHATDHSCDRELRK